MELVIPKEAVWVSDKSAVSTHRVAVVNVAVDHERRGAIEVLRRVGLYQSLARQEKKKTLYLHECQGTAGRHCTGQSWSLGSGWQARSRLHTR